jgi:hypothetical protein
VPITIPDVSYGGEDPDPVEWANGHIKPAVEDLDSRMIVADARAGMMPHVNQWLVPLASTTWSTSTGAFGSAVQFGVPIVVPRRMTINALMTRIATAESVVGLMLSLYSSDEDGHPLTLVASGSALSGAAGAHVQSVTPVELEPGIYWGFLRSTAGVSLRLWALPSQNIASLSAYAGNGGEQRNPLPQADIGAYEAPAATLFGHTYSIVSTNGVPYFAIRRSA